MSIRLELEPGGALVESHVGESVQRELDRQLAAIHTLFEREPKASHRRLVSYLRAWTRSHTEERHTREVIRLAERARREFAVLVTIGIGGSDLSARVFHDVLNHRYHNELTREARGGAPEVYFTGDTFDPRGLHDLLEMLEGRGLLGRTLFNVISKSGRTGETIAALMIVRDRLQDHVYRDDPDGWRQQVLATTGFDPSSALYRMHEEKPFWGDVVLPVPEGVGGRFSAFSPVGTFFLAATAGPGETPRSRIEAAFKGVAAADARFHMPFGDPENTAYRLARWLHLAERWARKGTLLFYNYADNRPLGDWFVQLYEESIQERGEGLNVIATCGPTGNHSILNGILRGPRDKVVLFLHWEDLGSDLRVPIETGIGGELAAFEGKRMAAIQTASYHGTREDLTENGVPNATLALPARNVTVLCKLMRTLMDTVAVKGRLQGLHISEEGELDLTQELTYLQHGVEGYKERTRRIADEMEA